MMIIIYTDEQNFGENITSKELENAHVKWDKRCVNETYITESKSFVGKAEKFMCHIKNKVYLGWLLLSDL